MPRCDYLKRDASICEAPTLKGARLCCLHKNATPYKMCEAFCGKVVSTGHGRTKCTKCDPLKAKAQSRSHVKIAMKRPPLPSPAPEIPVFVPAVTIPPEVLEKELTASMAAYFEEVRRHIESRPGYDVSFSVPNICDMSGVIDITPEDADALRTYLEMDDVSKLIVRAFIYDGTGKGRPSVPHEPDIK